MTTTATAPSTRLVVFPCGCVSRFTDHRDGGWSWSDVVDVYICRPCAAARAAIRATAAAARIAAPKPAVEDWERALLASIGITI